MRSSPAVTPAPHALRASATSDSILGAVEIFDVVTILQEAPERLGDGLRVEVRPVQPDERLRPVDRFGDARRLRQPPAAERLHESPDLARELLARAGRLELQDPHLFLERRMFDEEIQAPAAQRVADLAAAIGRQDHVRDVLGADRAELGNRHLEVGQDLEQERLEALVGPIDLVDQQDGRTAAPRDGAQERTLEQVLAAEDERLDVRGACARRAPRAGRAASGGDSSTRRAPC